jgi:TonB family protein
MAFGASGKIVLNLSIDEEGNVVNVEVVKGINSIYDREVVRVLKTTKWNPGTLGGKPARVKCGTTILVHM